MLYVKMKAGNIIVYVLSVVMPSMKPSAGRSISTPTVKSLHLLLHLENNPDGVCALTRRAFETDPTRLVLMRV